MSKTAYPHIACLLLSLLTGLTFASQPAIGKRLQGYVQNHQKRILAELVEALSIPDVASDRTNVRKKAEWLRQMLLRRGFSASLLETRGNPLVYGELLVPGAERTLLIYCHYDGQPVDPSRWQQKSPWSPVMRDNKLEEGGRVIADFLNRDHFPDNWRLYARSASDDTSPIIALVTALDALSENDLSPTSNLRVILDGEEEAGSPSLVPAIELYRNRLVSDLLLILDGPIHPSDRPTLVFGARGIITFQLKVHGPRVPLHSGHFGNWVPNPATDLALLLASMKDGDGRTTIDGFYEGIAFTAEDRLAFKEVPDDPEQLMELFGIARTDKVGSSLQEARNYPSLNIRGLRSGWVETEVRTIIPDYALAEIDIRLVLETDREVLERKFLDHIRAQGFQIVHQAPTAEERMRFERIVQITRGDGTNAFRTPMDHPLAVRLARSIREVQGAEPVLIRTSGGTVPISPFVEILGTPAVSVPIVNFDNNQHSPNENLRLGHLYRGVLTIAAALLL